MIGHLSSDSCLKFELRSAKREKRMAFMNARTKLLTLTAWRAVAVVVVTTHFVCGPTLAASPCEEAYSDLKRFEEQSNELVSAANKVANEAITNNDFCSDANLQAQDALFNYKQRRARFAKNYVEACSKQDPKHETDMVYYRLAGVLNPTETPLRITCTLRDAASPD
jgi:hypothetical protein